MIEVNVDYYDDEILNCLTEKSMKESRVVGEFLYSNPIHVSDLIGFWCIEEMINQ